MSDAMKVESVEPEAVITTASVDQVATQNDDKPCTAENSGDTVVKTEETKTNGAGLADKNGVTTKENATKQRGDSRRQSGRDQGHYQKRPNKSKFDPSAVELSDEPEKIRNQVEFYFSDSNLPTDNYLWGLVDGPTNLPVKLSKVCTFGRMRQYSYPAVVAALRDSVTLDISGPEGLEEIKRKVPFNPNKKDDRDNRTVYAKGFGEEIPSTQFDIEAFFAPYGPLNCVRLRRDEFKGFKGSVLVEFQDEETAQKFLDLDPKPLWQGKHELKIMRHAEYREEKNERIRNGEIEPNKTRPPFRGRGKSGWGSGSRNDRDRDPDDWKKRREEDQKSGFRDHKRDRDNRHQGGRGGRGRGRGDRRNNDRNMEREERERDKGENGHTEATSSDVQDVAKQSEQEPSNKRSREDDNGTDEVPAKRLDQKGEVSNEAS